MSFWKILTSPSGAEGTRASVASAMRTNLKRANSGVSFSDRIDAIAHTLELRYRVVRGRHFENPTKIESVPLAYASAARLPDIIAEYVVAQEHPSDAHEWVKPVVLQIINDFFDDRSPDLSAHQAGIYTWLDLQTLHVCWSDWLNSELKSKIMARGREMEQDRWRKNRQ